MQEPETFRAHDKLTRAQSRVLLGAALGTTALLRWRCRLRILRLLRFYREDTLVC